KFQNPDDSRITSDVITLPYDAPNRDAPGGAPSGGDMIASRQANAGTAPPPPWARRPTNLAKAITAELVDRIVRGVHPAGTPLPPEPALCETFAVSRTVVRESVKILQEKGLVQVRQGTGTIVTPPTAWDMLDELVLA